MGNPIPTVSREQVKAREAGRCFRCGCPCVDGEWHHRRGRSVRDEHTHCSCNGVWLCKTCHAWCHAHPFEAKSEGLVVTRFQMEPGGVAAMSYFGPILLRCDGTFDLTEEEAG